MAEGGVKSKKCDEIRNHVSHELFNFLEIFVFLARGQEGGGGFEDFETKKIG